MAVFDIQVQEITMKSPYKNLLKSRSIGKAHGETWGGTPPPSQGSQGWVRGRVPRRYSTCTCSEATDPRFPHSLHGWLNPLEVAHFLGFFLHFSYCWVSSIAFTDLFFCGLYTPKYNIYIYMYKQKYYELSQKYPLLFSQKGQQTSTSRANIQ